MDPWRQQILADIGIPNWIRREHLPAQLEAEAEAGAEGKADKPVKANAVATTRGAATSAQGRVPHPTKQSAKSHQARHSGTAAESALAALSQSLDPGQDSRSTRRGAAAASSPAPAIHEQPVGQASAVQPVRYPEVACLWSGNALLFCPPEEMLGQVRLVKDILASAANNWTQATEQLVFRWAELQASGFDPTEADRALLAFAEKRIEVSSARWVLSTPTLQPLLSQLALPLGARLLGLAELPKLAREAALKQQLWQTLAENGEGPNRAG